MAHRKVFSACTVLPATAAATLVPAAFYPGVDPGRPLVTALGHPPTPHRHPPYPLLAAAVRAAGRHRHAANA